MKKKAAGPTELKVLRALWDLALATAGDGYFTAAEIAKVAGVSPSTVRRHLEDEHGFGVYPADVKWMTAGGWERPGSRRYGLRRRALLNEIKRLRLAQEGADAG